MRCSIAVSNFFELTKRKEKREGKEKSEEIEKSRLRNNIHDKNGTRKVSVGNGKYEGRLKNVYCPVQDRVQGYGEKERKGEREREKRKEEGVRVSVSRTEEQISQIYGSIIVCQCERLIYIPARFNKCSSHVHPIIGILASLPCARSRVREVAR